ncbi:MAG: hypothetical protein RL357_1329 [Pseudomonadota bacterium]
MSQRTYNVAVLGLGAVGQRMLDQTAQHPQFQVVAGFDIAESARAHTAQHYPSVKLCASAEEAIADPRVDIVYVATPPLYHAALCRTCIVHRKAVFCEKPLGVDLDDSAKLVSEIKAAGLPEAVNFVFASAPAVDVLESRINNATFGLRQVHIRLHFHRWPRPFQAHAPWLSGSAQGGFTREVTSHFVYLLSRLLGRVELRSVQGVRSHADMAEESLMAHLSAGGIPVSLVASTGGQPKEIVSAHFIGEQTSLCLNNWYSLLQCDAEHPDGLSLAHDLDPRTTTYQAQLSQVAAMMQGETHRLPNFQTAFEVQQIVEQMLIEV